MQVPNEFLFNYEKGTELLHQRRFTEALPYLEKALTYLRDPAVLINLSIVLKETGDFAEARKLLLEAYDKVPENETEIRGIICYNMGNNLREEGKGNESIRWYQEAISLRKNLAKQHFNLGQAYFLIGDWDKALEQYEYVLTHIDRRDPDALRQKELTLHLKKTGAKSWEHKDSREMPPYKWKDYLAEQHYREAFKLLLMDATIKQVKFEFDEVLRREPENENSEFWSQACNTYASVAIAERDDGLAKRAIELGEKALRLHEEGHYLDKVNLYVLYEGLAAGYFMIDNNSKAETYCKKALNIVPDSERMNGMLNEINKEKKLTGTSKATSSGKKGCFIATAVYGNPYAPPVILLKDFKDNILQKTLLGKIFIKIYYHLSPFFATAISKSEFLKKFAKMLIIKPVLRVAKFSKKCQN